MKAYNYQTLILFFLQFIFLTVTSQTPLGFSLTGAGYGSAIATDYQTIGLNPANLGWKRNDHFVNLGLGELGMKVYVEPLDRKLVSELFGGEDQFTRKEKMEAAEKFTGKKVDFNANLSVLGLSFQDASFGGIGLNIRERVLFNSTLGKVASDLMFNGYNSTYFDSLAVNSYGDTIGWASIPKLVSDILEGTKFSFIWFREYNVSYGRNFYSNEDFSLYGGIGLKYLEGYNAFSLNLGDDSEYISFAALNPALGVDFGATPSKIEGERYQAVGHGFGVDLGVSALLFDKLRLALSVIDLGQIKWNGNVYVVTNNFVKKAEDDGADNYSFLSLSENNAIENLKWGGWEGIESYTSKLPSNLIFGGAYMLNSVFEFGTDLYVPLNDAPGAQESLIVGLGSRMMPVKWFRYSIGLVSGGKNGTLVPMGFSFFPFNNEGFSWEMGIAVRDVITYFKQEKPTVSAAMGVFRFSFGNISSTRNIPVE